MPKVPDTILDPALAVAPRVLPRWKSSMNISVAAELFAGAGSTMLLLFAEAVTLRIPSIQEPLPPADWLHFVFWNEKPLADSCWRKLGSQIPLTLHWFDGYAADTVATTNTTAARREERGETMVTTTTTTSEGRDGQ